MKISTASRKQDIVANRLKKSGFAKRLSDAIEDTTTKEELDEVWLDIKTNAFQMIPGYWRNYYWEVYLEQIETLKDFEI